MAYRRKQGPVAAGDHRTPQSQGSAPSSYNYTSMDSMREPKLGLWGALARKAKGILDEDAATHKFEDYGQGQTTRKPDSSNVAQATHSRWSFENHVKTERSESRKRSEALAASVNQLGGRIRNALEVANAMAAKAKLVLRELKTVKADLAFAKERCAQLEEENKILRETKQKGVKTEEDDDLIRMQLETLLAEKSRLAQENSIYARENRFLREIVDFHQFATHNVVSFDDGDTKDSNPEGGSNHTYAENMFPVVEAYLAQEEVSPVSSRPESPIISPAEPSSPKSSNFPSSVVNSPRNASMPNTVVPDKD